MISAILILTVLMAVPTKAPAADAYIPCTVYCQVCECCDAVLDADSLVICTDVFSPPCARGCSRSYECQTTHEHFRLITSVCCQLEWGCW